MVLTPAGTTVHFQKWRSCTYTACRNAGLQAVSQYASGRFCDHLARSQVSVGFLNCRAVAELVPRLHVASLASHASLPAITLLRSQYLLAYSMKQSHSWEASGFSVKFLAFYGTRSFITAFTRARHLSVSWTRSIESMASHPTSCRCTLILSSLICLCAAIPIQNWTQKNRDVSPKYSNSYICDKLIPSTCLYLTFTYNTLSCL